MKLNKIVSTALIATLLSVNIQAKELISLNINDLEIMDFVKLTSKVIGKNILIDQEIKGKVKFEQNKPLYKEDVINILMYVLEDKGFTIIDNDGILRLVKLSNVAKHNTPVFHNTKGLTNYQMVTEVFTVEYSNVDYVASKIKHLISRNAKLVTDKNSNSIVITDFVSNIDTIKKVINLIVKDSKKEIQIVELNNLKGASVLADLKNVAKTVFNEKVEKEKVDILLNKDTNSIMFVGKKDNVHFLVEYLNEIEKKGSLVEKVVEVISLQNAESKNIFKIVNGIVAKKAYKDKNNRPFVSTDDEANSIILMGPKEEILYLTKLIEKLDIDRLQVYVKARIMEVSELGIRNVGLRYGLNAGRATNSGIFTMAAELGGMSGANLILPTGFDLDFGEATTTTTTTNGVTTTTSGNSKIKEALALGTTINLLENNDALDIVSEPSILCINNKESSIFIGVNKSIQVGTSTDKSGNATPKLERADIGLSLKVKPRISSKNKVILDISTKIEEVSSKQTNAQPDSDKKELQTTAIVNTGESVILGGYIKNKEQKIIDKVPFFGDIPVLGNLFKNRVRAKDKINLVIVVTPYIVPKTKDLTYIRNQLTQLKFLEEKYTKDTILRLEERNLVTSKENLDRDKKLLEVKEEQEEFKEEIKEFEEDNKVYIETGVVNKEESHHDKIKEMFGI
jgi:general secretion pathway protein D